MLEIVSACATAWRRTASQLGSVIISCVKVATVHASHRNGVEYEAGMINRQKRGEEEEEAEDERSLSGAFVKATPVTRARSEMKRAYESQSKNQDCVILGQMSQRRVTPTKLTYE